MFCVLCETLCVSLYLIQLSGCYNKVIDRLTDEQSLLSSFHTDLWNCYAYWKLQGILHKNRCAKDRLKQFVSNYQIITKFSVKVYAKTSKFNDFSRTMHQPKGWHDVEYELNIKWIQMRVYIIKAIISWRQTAQQNVYLNLCTQYDLPDIM